MRLACSTDPKESERRPRRAALAPKAAMGAGALLIALALLLAGRAVLGAPANPTGAPATPSPAAPSTPAAGTDPAQALAPPDPLASPGATGELMVHVAGAVSAPGVVTLPAGSRVVDAITAAGGATADADPDQLNLARPLADGEQVRVPHQGEDASTWDTPAGPAPPSSTTPHAGPGGRVNINTATAAELEALTGIGPALAQRIVEYRGTHGPFTSVEDLIEVPGIGQAKLEALREEASV